MALRCRQSLSTKVEKSLGIIHLGRNKKGASKPRPLQKPPPRGAENSTRSDAPLRGRGPSTASLHSRAKRLKLAVYLEAELTHAHVTSKFIMAVSDHA